MDPFGFGKRIHDEDACNPANWSALFIPLKAQFFEDFESGDKDEEYRIEGPRWNARTCRVGRPVVLSYGYGKRRRLHGVIISYRTEIVPESLPGWVECYGAPTGKLGDPVGAVIGIKVLGGVA